MIKHTGRPLMHIKCINGFHNLCGDMVTTDGPFAETKEVLGGFYLLDCADLDDAIKWASQIPGAWHGRVEVRPVVDFSEE